MARLRPSTYEDLLKIYDIIYRAERTEHPTKGDMGKYGDAANRHEIVMNYLLKTMKLVPEETRVLDASCGRGNLLRRLIAEGFEAEGTEIVPYLLRRDLRDLPVKILGYHQLQDLGEDSYDVVISCDVLEHLLNPAQARRALENLRHITKKWLFVTVGIWGGGAPNFPQALHSLRGLVADLHLIRAKKDWWRDLIRQYMNVEYTYNNRRELYMFGTKNT